MLWFLDNAIMFFFTIIASHNLILSTLAVTIIICIITMLLCLFLVRRSRNDWLVTHHSICTSRKRNIEIIRVY